MVAIAQNQLHYQNLKKLIDQNHLLDRQPVYYFLKISLNLALLALWIFIFLQINSNVFQILFAIPLGFILTQIYGMAHDAGHMAIAKSSFINDMIGVLHTGPLGGASYSWWKDKHNQHHAHPNELESDPDIDFPVVIFHPSQYQTKKPFQRWMIRHQTFFYIFLVSLVPYNMRFHSLRILYQNKAKYRLLETLTMLSHFVFFWGFIFNHLGGTKGLVFFMLTQATLGLHLAAIFAPNHKGMPILEKGTTLDFASKQIMTSRNVKSGMLTDFLYLGLNYQIEHHLFPSLPRNKMHAANLLVKDYCLKNKVPYYETDIITSYKEIYSELKKVQEAVSA